MCQVQNKYTCLTPTLMKMLPWLCANIVRCDPPPQPEILQIVLRVVDCIVRDLPKLKSPKKRERALKEVLQIIDRVVLNGNPQLYLDQILDYDL